MCYYLKQQIGQHDQNKNTTLGGAMNTMSFDGFVRSLKGQEGRIFILTSHNFRTSTPTSTLENGCTTMSGEYWYLV